MPRLVTEVCIVLRETAAANACHIDAGTGVCVFFEGNKPALTGTNEISVAVNIFHQSSASHGDLTTGVAVRQIPQSCARQASDSYIVTI